MLQVWRYAVAILLVLGCITSAEEHQMVVSKPFLRIDSRPASCASSQGVMCYDIVDICMRDGRMVHVSVVYTA